MGAAGECKPICTVASRQLCCSGSTWQGSEALNITHLHSSSGRPIVPAGGLQPNSFGTPPAPETGGAADYGSLSQPAQLKPKLARSMAADAMRNDQAGKCDKDQNCLLADWLDPQHSMPSLEPVAVLLHL